MGAIHRRAIFAAAFLTASTAFAAGTVPLAEPASPNHPLRAVVNGDWIAWYEYGDTDETASVYAINVNNPSAQSRLTVADGSAWIYNWCEWNPQIDVDNGSVFWSAYATSGPNGQVFQYNLNTQTQKIIGPTAYDYGQHAGFVAASSGRVVWQAWSYPYGSDVPGMAPVYSNWTGETPTFDIVAELPNPQGDLYGDAWPVPEISGDWVVWKDNRSGFAGGLYAKNLFTGEERTVKAPDAQFDVRPPVIDGDIIAWCQRDNTATGMGVNQVLAYDLATGATTLIVPNTSSVEHRSNVSISTYGDFRIIIWEDWRNNPPNNIRSDLDIWGYMWTDDITVGTSFAVVDGPGNQFRPFIDGQRVVYTDDSTGSEELKWLELGLPNGGLGDVNLDGVVNALDISPFIQRVTTHTFQTEADTNIDGTVNALDIAGFIRLVIHQAGTTVVPEPSAAAVVLLSWLGTLTRRRHA